MSGGHFDYKQRYFNEIKDSIERELNMYSNDYNEIVKEKMKEAIFYLSVAAIYAQRIDWLISQDDSEETFLERLSEDLEQLNTTIK